MITTRQPPRPVSPVAKAADMPAYSVRELMQGGAQVQLILDNAVYTLRVTRAGKLILTK